MPRRRRGVALTETDTDLLLEVERVGSVAQAARALGIGRDRAVYRLARIRAALALPVVRSRRGGRGSGRTELTAAGRRLLRGTRAAPELGAGRAVRPLEATLIEGSWSAHPTPKVRADDGTEIVVGFRARSGERVTVAVDPEMVLVARRRFATSARNVLVGHVERIEAADALRHRLVVRVGRLLVGAGITPASVRTLGIRPGSRVVLYLKATAVRRLGPRAH
jgi:molybdate transport repressor ModE-like protein/molybdopterin-binding protein